MAASWKYIDAHWNCACTQYNMLSMHNTALCAPSALLTSLGVVIVTTPQVTGASATARCPAGKVVIGGGCSAYTGQYYNIAIVKSIFAPPDGWYCEAARAPNFLQAQVICANP